MPQCPICQSVKHGHRAAGAFPVAVHGRLIGVMTTFSPVDVYLTDTDVTFLISALNSMGLALVAIYSRLVQQPLTEVKRLLPSLIHYTNAILRTAAGQTGVVPRVAAPIMGFPGGGLGIQPSPNFAQYAALHPSMNPFAASMQTGLPHGLTAAAAYGLKMPSQP